MQKLIIIAIIILVMLSPSGKNGGVADLSAEDLDAYGIAGAMIMVSPTRTDKPKPEPEPPKPVAKCECVNGKVSYDGGTSLSDCPCKLSDENCGCKTKTSIVDLFPRTVLVTHPMINGKPNCIPCISVDRDIVVPLRDERHVKSGWKVGKEASNNFQIIDLEEEGAMEEAQRLGLQFNSVPTFFLIRKNSTKKFVGNMSYNSYIQWIK